MPSLTESLTWAAALDRFLRGSQSVASVPGGDDIAWQQFSGKNLSCRVVFSQPSPDASNKAESGEAGSSSAASWKLSSDRQLRITVECGSTKTSDDQSEARSVAPSTCVERVEPVRRETASQPREAIILVRKGDQRHNVGTFAEGTGALLNNLSASGGCGPSEREQDLLPHRPSPGCCRNSASGYGDRYPLSRPAGCIQGMLSMSGYPRRPGRARCFNGHFWSHLVSSHAAPLLTRGGQSVLSWSH